MAHILLIEPDKLQAASITEFLDMAGHTFSWATNGQEAISLADELKPDLIIAELGLVGHSGIEFLYEFRSYKDWEQVPIIAFSSIVTNEKILSGPTWKSLNVSVVLSKSSTSLKQLLQSVGQVLNIVNV